MSRDGMMVTPKAMNKGKRKYGSLTRGGRKMARPAKSTFNSLTERKGEGSYRELAESLGYDANAIGFLNDLLKKKVTPSLEKENDLRQRLGLWPITESGYPVRKRKIERPYVTQEQTERREAMGITWEDVIQSGLSHWETYFDNWPHIEGWGNVENMEGFPKPPPGWKEKRGLQFLDEPIDTEEKEPDEIDS
jgi:hypothetical protein